MSQRKSVARRASSGRRASAKKGGGSRKSIAKGGGGGDKKSGGKKKGSASKTKGDPGFQEAEVTIPTLEPWFVLLRCKEPPLILRAIDTLYDYVTKNPDEHYKMTTKPIITALKTYAPTDLQFINVRAFRLLAELSQYPETHDYIKEDEPFLKFTCKTYTENPNNMWKEVATKVMSEITKDIEFCRKFVYELAEMGPIIKLFKVSDPDVAYNALIMVKNMFRQDDMAEKFVNTQEFMFATLFHLYDSQYKEVQRLALNLTHWLVFQPQTLHLKQLFVDEGGVDKLYNILLNKFAWRDVHPICLDILQTAYNNEERVASLRDEGLRNLINYLTYIEDDDLIAKALTVVVQWSKFIFGRFMFLKLGMLKTASDFMMQGNFDMKSSACQFINQIALDREKMRKIIQVLNVPALVDLITTPNYPNHLVTSAHTLLNNLMKFSRYDIAGYCRDSPLKEKLATWFKNEYESLPAENKRLVLNTLSIIAQNDFVRSIFIDYPLIDFLVNCVKDTREELYDVTPVVGEALIHLIKNEPYARQYLVSKGGQQAIMHELWTTKNNLLREMLCKCLVEAVENDELMKLKLVKDECLHWLLKKKVIWYESPAMKQLAAAFMENHLPTMFVYGSRLGFENVTKDGFFVFKENRPPNTLPIPFTNEDIRDLSVYIVGFDDFCYETVNVEKVETEKAKALETQDDQCILLLPEYPEKTFWHPLGYKLDNDIDFIKVKDKHTVTWTKDLELNKYLEKLNEKLKEIEEREMNHLMDEHQRGPSLIKDLKEEPLKPLPKGEISNTPDDTVMNALARVKASRPEKELLTGSNKIDIPAQKSGIKELVEEEEENIPREDVKLKLIPKPFDPDWVKERVRAIGDIVSQEMAGPEENEPCTYHTFNLFLEELKKTLGMNVVQLGSLKVGMKLERAVLFKVLADRIDLPCTLVRGSKGQCWNEVCILQMGNDNKGLAQMPRRLMFPTHVVDLWMNPGRVLAVQSKEANKYCGIQLNPQMYTREDWMAN